MEHETRDGKEKKRRVFIENRPNPFSAMFFILFSLSNSFTALAPLLLLLLTARNHRGAHGDPPWESRGEMRRKSWRSRGAEQQSPFPNA